MAGVADYNFTLSRERLRIVAESLRADVNGAVLPEEYQEDAKAALMVIDAALDNGEALYVPFPGEREN